MSLHPTLNNLLSKVDALDDILECPVCYERLSENISLCTQGHPVCRKCLKRILKCPLCNSKFEGTRDYLAESIISKFEEIKCVVTNLTLNSSVLCTEKKKPKPIVIEVEKFPCGINNCHETLSYDNMIDHVKNDHQRILIKEGVINSHKYTDLWTICHDYGSLWEKIIYIKNMGIFFLRISISNKGNVCGHLLNVSRSHNTENFYYKLEIDHPYKALCFDGLVHNTRNLHNKNPYLHIGGAIYRDGFGDYCFDCRLKVYRI